MGHAARNATPNTFSVGVVGLGDGGTSNLRSLTAIIREETMGGDQVGIGVSDTDDEGRCNALALSTLAGVRVTALCDVNRERLDRVAGELGTPVACYQDPEKFVADPAVDLVVVATPDHEHINLASAALAAGKAIFIEKPVATSMGDLGAFRRLVQRHTGRISFSEKYSFAYPVQAALARREQLGRLRWGSTLYTMWKCDRIMGQDGWRVHTRYNPCAGGLSHNFMTALLFEDTRISRVRATGRVATYRELRQHGGFDTMEGTLQFASGVYLNWTVCLAEQGANSPFRHRTVTHTFHFENGALVYGASPASDELIVEELPVDFEPEPPAHEWPRYNIEVLYGRMHRDVLAAIWDNRRPRHTIEQGINVAAACTLAFESAHQDGAWLEVPF